MRVSVTAEAPVAAELAAELTQEPGIEVEGPVPAKDLTEQAFGLIEAATLVTIVQGVVQLAGVLKRLADRRAQRHQTLHVKTPFGSVTLEFSEDVTSDELQTMLEPLFSTA